MTRISVPLAVLLAITPLSLFHPSLLANDWPHWRGPQSNGVSAVSSAPERWSATENVLWRTEIEGYGISSPVVFGNRVYLTTAVKWQGRTAPRLVCDFVVGCFAILGVPMLVRHRWKLRTNKASENRGSLMHRGLRSLDLTIFILLAIAVLVFGALMVLGPKAIDVGINSVRDVGVESARFLGRDQTNLWFLDWDEGRRHDTWIISTAIALGSLALTPFLFPAHLVIRVVGAIALLIGVALANVGVPWPASYGIRYPTGALVVMYSPVIALAAWHLLAALGSRLRAGRETSALTSKNSWLLVSVPAVVSLGAFTSPNYLSETEMLTRRLISLDADSGGRVWQTDVFTTPPEAKAALNSHATPTPSVVEDGIVAAFGLGIAAFNLNGHLRWSKTFPNWIKSSIYGAGSSPVTDGATVFLTQDREFEAQKPSRVIAYSLGTGREMWSTTPQFASDGYATPVIHDDGHRRLLLTITSKTLVGYDTASGATAWTLDIPVSQPVPSLIVDSGRLYVTGGRGADGYTAGYQLRQNAGPDELWASRRSPADVSSPVLYRQRLYTISSTGIMVSYDAASGDVIWRQRVGSGLGAFYGSLVAADNKIYAARSNGTTYVIAAEDTFRVISESPLPEEIFASPAVATDCFFVRTVAALYCIGNKD